MEADASTSPVTRCKMRHVQHPSVLLPLCFQAIWLAAGGILLIAVLICGVPIGPAPILHAQASRPATNAASGFTPATPFRYLNRFPPYPEGALNAGEEGVVLVRISISKDGKVSQVRVLRSSGSRTLDETTARWILRRWRYHPAMQNGMPIASTRDMAVTFAIKK